MKKIVFIAAVFILWISFDVYGLNNSFLDIRNKIFEESQEIKSLLPNSKDAILLSSVWDTCLIAMSQLDAYFHMLGIFNTIKEKDLSREAAAELSQWLSEIKRSSELNIKILNESARPVEASTKDHIEKIKSYFGGLNLKIDAELGKISSLDKSIKRKKR